MKLFFASQNANKIREIQTMIPTGMEILGIDDVIKDELEETGSTLEENALQKARFVARRTGQPSFADDTGLEIAALNGAPGVVSARYAGEEKDANANIRKVLAEMQSCDKRAAQFRTVIAFVDGENEHLFEGVVTGSIAANPIGEMGFGYDPIFIPDGESRTFAQMSLEEKNITSHRARAFTAFAAYLKG